jgi:hypothetical protein
MSVPVMEEVRACPSSEGGTVSIRVKYRLRVMWDMNSDLVSVLRPLSERTGKSWAAAGRSGSVPVREGVTVRAGPGEQ